MNLEVLKAIGTKISKNKCQKKYLKLSVIFFIELKSPESNIVKKYLVQMFNNSLEEKKIIDIIPKIKNSHIIKYYGGLNVNNKKHFVFEHLDLDFDHFSRNIPLRLHLSLLKNLIFQMLKAVAHLHKQGIVHTDLKPDTFSIKRSGYLKMIKLMEYRFNSKYSISTTGSPQFQCPENLEGKPYGMAKDIWSIGLIAYEAYYQESFYKIGKTNGETLRNMYWSCNRYFEERVFKNNNERQFKLFLLKCLQINPEERCSIIELMNNSWLMEPAVEDKKKILIDRARKLMLYACNS
jgi:serine/threonine protein kinase